MKRDFTEATKTEFINLVQEANESEWLKKKNPLDNVDDLLTFDVQFPWNTLEAYYRKMIDKNDMTVGKINKIWENVQILDSTYQARFLALNELAVAYKEKLRLLSNKIKPENIVNTLKSPSRQLEAELVTVNEKLNMSRKRYIYTLLIECKDDKVVIESNQNAKRNQRFEILSWRNSYFIEHNLGKKTILEIAGEKKTDAEVLQEKVASSLLLSGIEKAINSTYATIIKVIADIQNNQENNIKLDTSVTNIEVGNYIKTLGLNGNIIYENNNKVFMLNVMVNKVVLNIRVHVYKFSKGDGDDVKRNKSK